MLPVPDGANVIVKGQEKQKGTSLWNDACAHIGLYPHNGKYNKIYGTGRHLNGISPFEQNEGHQKIALELKYLNISTTNGLSDI